MKKFIIILIMIILLAVIAFNVGKLMARKVFEGDEELASSSEQITENTIEIQESENTQETSEITGE